VSVERDPFRVGVSAAGEYGRWLAGIDRRVETLERLPRTGGGGGSTADVPYAVARLSADDPVGVGWTVVLFDTLITAFPEWFTLAANEVTIHKPGLYLVNLQAESKANNAGAHTFLLDVNGGWVAAGTVYIENSLNTEGSSLQALIKVEGSPVTVRVRHQSGSTLVGQAVVADSTRLQINRLAGGGAPTRRLTRGPGTWRSPGRATSRAPSPSRSGTPRTPTGASTCSRWVTRSSSPMTRPPRRSPGSPGTS
jgi:hypothetical protein